MQRCAPHCILHVQLASSDKLGILEGMHGPAVNFGALTDVGQKRDHNEDNYLVDKKLSLFVVCDGMGGHAAGEVASAIAVRTIHEEVKAQEDLLADYVAKKAGGAKVSQRDISNMLEFAVNRASSKIHSVAAADPTKRGMGTTLVAVLFVESQAFIVHVGDSRIYLLRNRALEQLTDDHNVYNELVKHKKLTREQVMQLAPKNAITRAVGVYESCEPETLVLDIVPGDRFLLCTDGLSEYFEAPSGNLDELAQTLMDNDEESATRKLIDLANARGGKDNITAVVVSIAAAGKDDAAQAQRLERRKQVLSHVPLFRPLNDRELRRVLQVTTVRTFEDGQAIIREGERDDALFIVLDGEVVVSRGVTQVKTLSVGEHFGEMALIRNQPRSATVVASGPAELLAIERSEFFEILRTQPRLAVKLLWQFTGVLADRLAETTRDLGQARTELAEELAIEDVTEELFTTDNDFDEDRKTVELLESPFDVQAEDLTEEAAPASSQIPPPVTPRPPLSAPTQTSVADEGPGPQEPPPASAAPRISSKPPRISSKPPRPKPSKPPGA